jgi:hypothetical protein
VRRCRCSEDPSIATFEPHIAGTSQRMRTGSTLELSGTRLPAAIGDSAEFA